MLARTEYDPVEPGEPQGELAENQSRLGENGAEPAENGPGSAARE